jgi:predicted nucleotidyltransferase
MMSVAAMKSPLAAPGGAACVRTPERRRRIGMTTPMPAREERPGDGGPFAPIAGRHYSQIFYASPDQSTMITRKAIARLCKRIADQFSPERIILFGSRAYGRARRDSDVDLLVVMRYRGMSMRKAAEIRNRVEPEFPVDLIVRSPRELEKRTALGDQFIGEIVRKGLVLYSMMLPSTSADACTPRDRGSNESEAAPSRGRAHGRFGKRS